MVSGEVTYTLYLMSNSHIGLDQQFDLRFNISPVWKSEKPHAK
jgi:hypothetical protein